MSCTASPVSAARSSSARVTACTAAGRSASSTVSTCSASTLSEPSPASFSITREVAACATVAPKRLASMMRSANSGCHCSCHTSWKVPRLERWPAVGAPHGSSSRRSRCSRWLRARSLGWRRSRSSVRAVASGFRRRLFCCCSMSRCSGTVGTSAGTWPMRSPTVRRSRISVSGACSPMQITLRTASSSSGRPGAGRSRSAASVSARRVASIRWAEEQSRSCSRRSRATRASQPVLRPATCWPCCQRCSYQPGESMPAP